MPERLGALHDLVRRLERDGRVRPASAGADGEGPAAVATGWAGLDGRLATFEGAPGLARGALHEWFGPGGGPGETAPSAPWTAPRLLLAALAARALDERLARPGARTGRVLWIGRAVWPYPAALLAVDELRELAPDGERGGGRGGGSGDAAPLTLDLALDARPCPGPALERPLFARSLLVDPPDAAARLWTIDAALRCPTVTAVVADGSGLDMAATRRLALAANTGEALVLLARPPRDEGSLSAACTRWRVRRLAAAPAGTSAGTSTATPAGAPGVALDVMPSWHLELVRAKPPQQLRPPRPLQPGRELEPCAG